MTYRQLFLFVEGDDDERFFRSVVLLAIGRCADTSTITKEAFEAAVLQSGQPKLPTMLALLESFDREAAVDRNESFRRFLRKFVPTPA
jgi:hypothetical protein